MPVILHFVWGIDSRNGLESLDGAVLSTCGNRDRHARLNSCCDSGHIIRFKTRKSQDRGCITFLELKREHAHAHKIAAMNPLEAFGKHGGDAEQTRTFGGPVPD